MIAGVALVVGGCSAAATPAPSEHPKARAPETTSASEEAIRLRKAALATMKRATTFMVEKASYRGGYVWSYLADFSRRWGEMEAYETMIWVQPPGTATVGQLLLDAYEATGDDYYYLAAARAGEALALGQHASGGWNYMIDFAGEASLRRWYQTIGKNGWRLEEFQHFYDNATFDDGGTAESTRFLLRLYVERGDAKFRVAAERAVRFILDSQHANGCFPQRHPMTEKSVSDGQPEFPRYFTFNDDVAAENIDVLIMVYRTLGDPSVLEPVRRAMDCFLKLEGTPPQAGWSLQYGPDLAPAAARNYEPAELSTKTTYQNVAELSNFYALTGQKKYLERIPAALAWLESVRLPGTPNGVPGEYPATVAVGSNRPMYVHRRGSNVTNGKYYFDEDPKKTIVHSKQIRELDVEALRARYLELSSLSLEKATAGSPLLAPPATHGKTALPRFFTNLDLPLSDMTRRRPDEPVSPDLVRRLVGELNEAGYWPAKIERISNPYRGSGPREIAPGDFSETEVGDEWDTSPFRSENAPIGISTRVYLKNMFTLVRYVAQGGDSHGSDGNGSKAH
jgi:PelA/Pel-15E family pectate lyase